MRYTRLLRCLFVACLLAALIFVFFSLPRRPMPVLMYHHIIEDESDEPLNDMTVTEGKFREDMQWLIDHGYTFVLPRELAAGVPLPDKPVMVTFDDGYRSNYYVLFSILQEMDVKAAIAMVVAKTDVEQDIGFLSWDMCREMAASGLVEFGSHTYDLHNFDERDGSYVPGTANGILRRDGESRTEYEARVLTDLKKSIDAIETQIGGKVCYFAYPFGARDSWADSFVRTHFPVTVGTHADYADPGKDLQYMNRFTVTVQDPVSRFLRS